MFEVVGQGNGALSAFIDGLVKSTGKQIHVTNYAEHAINTKTTQSQSDDELSDNQTNSLAAAYIQLSVDGQIYSGIGTCNSTVSAMLKAVLSALSQTV